MRLLAMPVKIDRCVITRAGGNPFSAIFCVRPMDSRLRGNDTSPHNSASFKYTSVAIQKVP